MKEEMKYESPKIEIIEVEVENGFAGSVGVNLTGDSWEQGSSGNLVTD